MAAIIQFDGGPVERGSIERMTARMAYRGIDGIRHWHGYGAALGYCTLNTTAESSAITQPLHADAGAQTLLFDGYLHNLEELRAALQYRGAQLHFGSDAEVVLAAYREWGEGFVERLEGEFALMIWDAGRHTAYCARDHAGLKPLHLSWDGKRLIVATDISAILEVPGVPRVLNERIAVEIAANEWFTRGETIWAGIESLLPATWSRFEMKGRHDQLYWTPPLEIAIRYARDEQYVDHYRDLLADCVRRCSRSHRPIAADVSGGLDSSAVFAVGHDLKRHGALMAPDLLGYTFAFHDHSGSEADELNYARAVAAHVGQPVREIAPFLPNLPWFVQRGREDSDLAPYPNATMSVATGEALVADGCRVSLNGEGGDEWLGGCAYYYHEMLVEGGWRVVAQSLREDLADIGPRDTAYRFARWGLAPFAPRSALQLGRRLFLSNENRQPGGYPWLTAHGRKLLETQRAVVSRDLDVVNNRARRSMLANLRSSFADLARTQYDRQCARLGYETRTPMYARRFLEFAFSIPERLRLRGEQRKHIHVAAMQGLLPELVRLRQTKADFSLAFDRLIGADTKSSTMHYPTWDNPIVGSNGLAQIMDLYHRAAPDSRPIWEWWGTHALLALLNESDRSD